MEGLHDPPPGQLKRQPHRHAAFTVERRVAYAVRHDDDVTRTLNALENPRIIVFDVAIVMAA